MSSMLELSPDEWTALILSLKVASVAVLFSLPLAMAAAWLLVRRRFPGIIFLDGLIHLPLTLPPVVTGYLLLLTFGNQGVLGRFLSETFGLTFAFRWTGAALAAAIMGFPLMVRAIRVSLESVNPQLEEAAATLGAGPFTRMLTVTLPLMMPGILSGAVLGFARALGEFGATITFVSAIPGETQTLASAIYGFTQTPGGDSHALRLTLIAVLLSMIALLASEWLARWGRPKI